MICAGCPVSFEPRRKDQRYHSPACRAADHRERNRVKGVVRAARVLKSGTLSYIVHVAPLFAQKAYIRVKGDSVELVGHGGRG